MPFKQTTCASLVLADGSIWQIKALDPCAVVYVSRLVEAMNMQPEELFPDKSESGVSETGDKAVDQCLFVSVANHRLGSNPGNPMEPLDTSSSQMGTDFASFRQSIFTKWFSLHEKDDRTSHCVLKPLEDGRFPTVQTVRLSLAMALRAQTNGGMLLHGALAERDGLGVIIAGPSGVGKTRLSNRIPLPWRSLSDDNVLVVRDSLGVYWAHPWPTWSNLMLGGQGGVWDVKHSIPLAGIFFISKGETDHVISIGEGEAACLLVPSIEQAYRLISRDLLVSDWRLLSLKFFENACKLVKNIPCHRLFVSFEGPFWREIDCVLAMEGKEDR